MKTKNPLYVVKGKDVQEASNLFDLVIKKFNLEPMIEVFQNILRMLLEQIKSYPSLMVIKKILDELIVKYFGLVSKFGLAQ
jgi:hypothetical protein